MTWGELAGLLGHNYGLDVAIIERIKFSYKTFVGGQGNTKNVPFDANQPISGTRRVNRSPTVPPIPITINDVNVSVRLKLGDMVETDCSCDLNYMLGAMDRVGQKIREAFHWVPQNELCYLVIDNAGGHGTDDTIKVYTSWLRIKWGVHIILQVPRSPYTNVLDLGVWCTLQAAVEKAHFMQRTDVHALVNSVNRTWDNGGLDQAITNVFGRLRNVLVLLVE